jgi:ankyrin repeat protein
MPVPSGRISRVGLVGALLATVLGACSVGGDAPDGPASGSSGPLASPAPPTSTTARGVVGERQARLDDALIEAAWEGDVRRARQLVADGADVNHQDDSQQSPYLIATSQGHLDLLELTLRHGADVGSLDSFNGTGLIRAADRGHADIVGRLLRTDIDVDHVNNLGWTALHEAILLGDGSRRYVDTVRLLVAGGADVERPSRHEGVPPVDQARTEGHRAIETTLRAALEGGPVRNPDAALLRAASDGDADRVSLAIRAGADLETRDSRRRTPLLLAVTHDRLAVARVLVALGADPDARDDRRDTPWLVTGVTGSVAMADVLLPYGPDLSLLNRFGGTSLIPASERGHAGYVRRVVRTGIDVNHVNDLGWTALLEAVILGDGSRPYQRIVRILLDADADASIPDRDGVTARRHAVVRGQTAVARLLSDA